MQNLNDLEPLENDEQHSYNLAETEQNRTEQNRTEQAAPTASLTEIDSASFLTTLSDGTPTWQSENYFYAWPTGATDITVRPKAKDELVGATYNLFAWQSLKTKESTQVAFFLSYYKAAPPKSPPIDPIEGVTALRYGERNYLMVATRLYAEGKTKQAPEALAEDMRKWNNNIAEPFFLTAEGHQFYYKNPLTVNVSPFNNFENHAIGRSGNVGELSQLKIKPTKTYKMEVGELGGGGKMDNYPAKKIYADIIDPNTSIDNSPYERAVKKEQLDQMPGPFDNWFFRTLDLITAAGGGIGNAAKGNNTLHGGSYTNKTKSLNSTQGKTITKPRGEQRPTGKKNKSYKPITDRIDNPKYNSTFSRESVKPQVEQKEVTIDWQKIAKHANEGDFPLNPNSKKTANQTLKGGAHGSVAKQKMKAINMTYNILHTYGNGVQIGNVPSHKDKLKKTGTGQSWFPDYWTDADIISAGIHVLKKNPDWQTIPNGTPFYANFKGVRVGVIKTDGLPATVFPDGTFQPTPINPNIYEFNPYPNGN